MEKDIKKILEYYNMANDLKYMTGTYNGKTIKSVAAEVFSKYSIATGKYLDSTSDYSLGEIIRFITLASTLNKCKLTNKDKEREFFNSCFSDDTKINKYIEEVYNSSLYYKLNRPIDEPSRFVLDSRKLLFLPRKGHLLWGAKAPRLESVAEHIFGTCALALGILSETNGEKKLDENKILEMLAVHEIEEITIGDNSEFEIDKKTKLEEGTKSVNKLLNSYKKGKEVEELLDEFNSGDTPEAQFAYYCDKMEYLLQVKKYEELGFYDFTNRPKNICTESKRVKEIIESGATSVFDVHAVYDESKFKNSELFSRMLSYLQNHNLSTKEERTNVLKLMK